MPALACLFLALAVLLGGAGPAFAHAAFVRSSPADGATIAAPPDTFSLTFSEPTSPIVLRLVRPGGDAVILDRFVLRDTTLEIEAPDGLGTGTHVLTWRVVSVDGHPVGGSVVFAIGEASPGSAPGVAEAVDWPVRTAIWTSRIVLYVGLFFGVGGIFFRHWIAPAARPARLASVAGIAAGLFSIGPQGLDALGLSLPGLLDWSVWQAGFSTSHGGSVVLAVLALAAGLAATRMAGLWGKGLSLLAFVAMGAALAASGHASAAPPQWLTRPAVFLHAAGIAFWAGALVPLGRVLAARDGGAGRALGRFSRLAPLALLPLVLAGLLLAAIQLGRPQALWTTPYGWVLLLKLALLAGLFALAAINRYRLTAGALAGDARAGRSLRRSIAAEIALVLVILAVAAAWRFTPPPRALADAAPPPATAHMHGKAMADLTIRPGRAGPVSVEIAIMAPDFGPLAAEEVTLMLANPAAGIEPIRGSATLAADGVWRIDRLMLPLPGDWSARVDIFVSAFERVRLEGGIAIAR